MKHTITWRTLAAAAALGIMLLLNGCNLTPTDQKPYSLMPSTDSTVTADAVTVTYSYTDTSSVQLSANPVTLKTGQKLVLEPAPGFSGRTRFVSSGEGYIGSVMRQEADPNPSTHVVFTAIKPGTGKLQIIPNMTETERAVNLTITVQ